MSSQSLCGGGRGGGTKTRKGNRKYLKCQEKKNQHISWVSPKDGPKSRTRTCAAVGRLFGELNILESFLWQMMKNYEIRSIALPFVLLGELHDLS